jgi:hypothetical protein
MRWPFSRKRIQPKVDAQYGTGWKCATLACTRRAAMVETDDESGEDPLGGPLDTVVLLWSVA